VPAVSETSASDVTLLLDALARGEAEASDRLFPVVYGELRRIAGSAMRAERQGHTLQPTALVHEAYLRLVKQRDVRWESRGHFFAIAAQAMRRVLVDHARRRAALKRPATTLSLPADDVKEPSDAPSLDLIALDLAMDKLGAKDARLVKVVELRFFAGLNVDETASAMSVSPRTVKRDWHVARAWLKRELAPEPGRA
jgi:RNA polymerase sigma factor (TIGR02999 family)